MAIDSQLESYLATLDKALGPIPVSSRADIITEIKSHVMEAQERDPNAKLGNILKALGEPESVANRYLLERGLKPGKAARTPIFKWLTIGFLGTLGMICFTLLALVWHFTPLISVDEKSDHVTLLGGTIDVNGKTGFAKIGQFSFDSDSSSKVTAGAKELPKGTSRVNIPFVNGRINLTTSKDGQVHWNCKFKGGETKSTTKMEANAMTFDFGSAANVKCDIEVPEKIEASIKGNNGKVVVEKLRGDLDVNLVNGKVALAPDQAVHYNYDLQVHNGRVDDFDSSSDPNSVHVKMKINNGIISKDE